MQHIDTLCRVAQTHYNSLYGGGKANFISEWDVALQEKKKKEKKNNNNQSSKVPGCSLDSGKGNPNKLKKQCYDCIANCV